MHRCHPDMSGSHTLHEIASSLHSSLQRRADAIVIVNNISDRMGVHEASHPSGHSPTGGARSHL